MKESYGKGVTSHPGSESCVASHEAAIEALTGGSAGAVFNCQRLLFCFRTHLSRDTQAGARQERPEAALNIRFRGEVLPEYDATVLHGNRRLSASGEKTALPEKGNAEVSRFLALKRPNSKREHYAPSYR